MRVKKVANSEHGPRHVTPAGRSEHWLEKSRMTQAEAAKVLGVTQARVSDLKRGKIDRFSMDLLVRLAARAGLKPKLKLAA
jgi:predicted XRE-type DNA-binding protein